MDKSVDRDRLLELENALHRIARSTAALWVAIERGVYNARSVCGDRALDIKEALEECGFSLPLGSAREVCGGDGGKHVFELVECDGDRDTYSCVHCQHTKTVRCTFDEEYA